MRHGGFIYGLIIALVLVISIGISYKGMQEGRTGDDYTEICIHGHSYWTATFGMKGMTTIRLDDDGKPVKCEVK